MDPRTRRTMRLSALAAAMGILADATLRPQPWGLGIFLWILLLNAALLKGLRGWRSLARAARWLWVPPLLALGMAVRDSPLLRDWTLLALLAALVLVSLEARGAPISTMGFWRMGLGAAEAALSALAGPLTLTREPSQWGEPTRRSGLRRYAPVLMGVLIAVPLALVFGALFSSADPVFGRLLRSLLRWGTETLASHLLFAGFVAWVVLGYLAVLAFGSPSPPPFPFPLRIHRSGIAEIVIPLSTLVLFFATFIGIQLGYLFGGEELVQSATGLTFAEYARRGFFELVAVVALVVPVLLAADALLDANREQARRVCRALSAALLLLTAAVMTSALTRMLLYVDAYGLTADRLYATAFMLWIGLVLVWFAGTVLRGRAERFPLGAASTGLAVVVALNLVNPDGTIARTNLGRAAQGRSLDASYVASLSADAVPAVLERLTTLAPSDACEILTGFRESAWVRREPDWRSWNLGWWRARQALDGASVFEVEKSCPSDSPIEASPHPPGSAPISRGFGGWP